MSVYYKNTNYYKGNKKKPYRNVKYVSYTDSEGIRQENIVDTDLRNKLTKPLFMVSISLLLGSFFFNGFFGRNILSTVTETVVVDSPYLENDIQYRIKASNYDYTQKLTQLSGLRNIFSLNDFAEDDKYYEYQSLKRLPSVTFDYDTFPYVQDRDAIKTLLDNNILTIVTYVDSEITYPNHINNFRREMAVDDIPKEYLNIYYTIYDNYVNNYYIYQTGYVEWYKENILNLSIEEWYEPILRIIRVLNAPFIWTSNLLHDLGVITNFIVNW